MVGSNPAASPCSCQPRHPVLSRHLRRRHHHIPPWLRFFIWLSFLGSDAVAIYALATLFNRQKEVQVQQISSAAHESHDLEVFWTPILLMHLGGQISISAYNLEDNELWTRRIITSLSQITVAIYVFWKSWSSSADKRLLAAAILIFIPGILKCMDKPLCLRESSFSNTANLSNDPWNLHEIRDQEEEGIEEYIQEARAFIASPNPSPSPDIVVNYLLYTDLARHYDVRLRNLKSFWVLKHQEGYNASKVGLHRTFSKFYNKIHGSVVTNYLGELKYYFIFNVLPWMLLLVAAVLFHSSNKQAYKARDIIVTLMLLYGTMLLELISNWSVLRPSEWHDMVAQHSFTEFAAYALCGKSKLLRLAPSIGGLRLLLLGYWCMEPCKSSETITSTVRGYVKLWWGEFITDAEHYRKVSGFRGQWTLERNDLVVQLGWSLDKPFDESVLLWHIATDFCCHSSPLHPSLCIEISNYMAHLLVHKPDMLMAGSRKVLFTTAIVQLTAIRKRKSKSWEGGPLKLSEKVMIEEIPNGNFIHDAKLLAEGLMGIGHDKMWQVIEGVWVDMLCFSAGRCPGHLHIKSLGSGGEYLSSVWLMLEHAGMESLPDRLQKRSLFGHNIMSQNHQNSGESFQDARSSISQDEGTISIAIDP